ncbi:MAG: isoaspartyl peptidase/L-asparaginase [bacterium]|nr:isoaspartyl peptidase/L-asparaginase [bacterium]
MDILALEKNPGQNFGLVLHGGAGVIAKGKLTPEQETARREKLKEALMAGYNILKKGGPSLDAVEAAIRILEDSPLFNAGKGAVFTGDGTNELDSSIMDGKTLNAGAIAGVKHIKNPITLARKVMERSPHVMLSREGAEAFAKTLGLEFVPADYFHTESRWKSLQRAKEKEKKARKSNKAQNINAAADTPEKFGTVGVAALDKAGNLAAGTSTGGMTNKKFGRIGDSPIIGAGTYANNKTCAVSSTGHGEYFIRAMVAYDISALMEYKGFSLEEAATEVVMKKLKKLGGTGGIIAIDNKGNPAMIFNTPGMYRGHIDKNGTITIKFYND